jgi:hypothetical protein
MSKPAMTMMCRMTENPDQFAELNTPAANATLTRRRRRTFSARRVAGFRTEKIKFE